jgi:hypothetical protein
MSRDMDSIPFCLIVVLFYQPEIRLKTHTKNNLIDVPEKATSSFTEASIKIKILRVLSKSN